MGYQKKSPVLALNPASVATLKTQSPGPATPSGKEWVIKERAPRIGAHAVLVAQLVDEGRCSS